MGGHFSALAVLAMALLQAPVAAQSPPAFHRLRCIDLQACGLLDDAWQRSATVRALVEKLEKSDLIVYVESQKAAGLRARLRFVSTVQGCRYLRVSVRVPGLREHVLPALAHELHHATEIADVLEVRNEHALEALLKRIGWEWRHTVFETEPALMVEEQVRLEVMSTAKRH